MEFFYKKDRNIKLPEKSTKFSAGWDLFCPYDINIDAGERIKIKSGVFLTKEMEKQNLFCEVRDRSSMYMKGFKVFQGVIDADYEGEIIIVLTNTTDERLNIGCGHKFAQLTLYPLVGGESEMAKSRFCLLYTSPSPRDGATSRMPSSA